MAIRRVVPAEASQVRADLRAMQRDVSRGDVIRRGDTGKEVKALQRDLKRLGFLHGPVDGQLGPVTQAAVQRFQRAHALADTGVVDQRTLDALSQSHLFVDDKFTTPAERGQSGKDLLAVERKLQFIGLNPGRVDGVFDKQTLKAVRGLRKRDAQLDDTSRVIDRAFVRELDKEVARPALRTKRTLAMFDRTEPKHDYRHVQFRGATMNARTREMLKRAEFVMRHKLGHPDFRFQVTQGSYNTSVGASAGTHDGGGALDLRTSGFGNGKIDDMVKAMRMAGFAAWSRGRGHDTFAPHIHAVALGDRQLSGRGASFGAFDQIPDYAHGRDGLSGHRVDPDRHVGRPVPHWAKRYL